MAVSKKVLALTAAAALGLSPAAAFADTAVIGADAAEGSVSGQVAQGVTIAGTTVPTAALVVGGAAAVVGVAVAVDAANDDDDNVYDDDDDAAGTTTQ